MTWADIIRRTYKDGGVEDVISTRRSSTLLVPLMSSGVRLTRLLSSAPTVSMRTPSLSSLSCLKKSLVNPMKVTIKQILMCLPDAPDGFHHSVEQVSPLVHRGMVTPRG